MGRGPAGIATVVGLFAALAGCAELSLLKLYGPASGGPAWLELRSPHFLLSTDLAQDDAKRLLGEFETTYAAFTDVAFPSANPPSLFTELVVFRAHAEYNHFAPNENAIAYYTVGRNDAEPRPTVVMTGT